ncbi:MAG TPA: tetratricopeptide repeat protein [Devosiaceae bacterium]|jgi:Flp pilus assembly protein TadD|nr:tetratricopeptide repeat protein [Devosiaceae bacterium]
MNTRSLRTLLLAGAATMVLAGCASNRTTSMESPDFSGLSRVEAQATLDQLAVRYKQNPKDKATVIHFAAALRANDQPEQAVAVLEAGMAAHRGDRDLAVAYAKALAAAGRFQQGLAVVEGAIDPALPDWNALSVKGAILDQSGRNEEARRCYQQALQIAPGEASLYANLGLSYAMTNDLAEAEVQLRKAVRLPGANSRIRQNLALVVGLQGRFDESKAMFTADLAPDQVDANMAYIRALLTQQNRWDLIKGAE